MLPGQWFINEVREKLDAFSARIDGLLERWAADQMANAEEAKRLRAEIAGLKMRMGKHKNEKGPHDERGTT